MPSASQEIWGPCKGKYQDFLVLVRSTRLKKQRNKEKGSLHIVLCLMKSTMGKGQLLANSCLGVSQPLPCFRA